MKRSIPLILLFAFSGHSVFADPAQIDRTVRQMNEAVKTPLSAPQGECCDVTNPHGSEGGKNLLDQVRKFRSVIQSERFDRKNCGPYLSQVYGNVFRASADTFDKDLLKANASEIINEIFATKLELRQAQARLEKDGLLPDDCVEALRNTFRAALFMTEYLAEHFVPGLGPGLGKDRVFEGTGPELLLNPKFGPKLELRSGDVLMSRGDAFVSGAISRIGDNDGNFSHIGIVYIDPETKNAYTVEAHIEVGVVVAPLETYLTDGKVRSTVFRQGDPELAHKAAKLMFERAKKQSATGKNIPYDFGMILEGKDPKGRAADHEVFCSEVAYLGYKQASDGKLLLPQYPTGLNMKNDTFLKDIGVVAKKTFAPSDMEVESRFELVAEWRNFKKTEKSRMTDAILTQTYDTMEKHNYELRTGFWDTRKRNLAYTLRKFGFMKEKIPDNMSRKAIGTMIALDKAAAPMLEKLKAANDEQKAKTGFSMTAPQMTDFLEELRKKDYDAYLARKKYNETWPEPAIGDESPIIDTRTVPPKPLYHDVFRPKKS